MLQKGTESQKNWMLYQESLQKPVAALGMGLLTYASAPSLLKHSSPQRQYHLLPPVDLCYYQFIGHLRLWDRG